MNKEHNYTMIQVLHAGLFEKIDHIDPRVGRGDDRK